MSEQSKSAFEAWYDNDISEPLPDDYTILGKRYLYMGWQAATAEANKRTAELESEIAELQERLETHIAINKSLLLQRDCLQADNKRLREGVAIIKNSSDSIKTILELQASNNDLREAGQALIDRWDCPKWKDVEHTGFFIDALRRALSATPAESLQAHDAETIKRYADDLDNNHWVFIPHDLRKPLKEVK